MWLNIFSFELKYRKARPATYIYFAILLLLGFLATSTDAIQVGGGSGQIKQNAPVSIARIELILTAFFGVFFASAIMGVAVLRDFEHKMESLLFSTPLRKWEYLIGRFLGSFLVLALVLFGLPLGMMLGQEIGQLAGWQEADNFLPFDFWTFLLPYLSHMLPVAFILSCIFFISGALSRKIIVVYTQSIMLLVLYIAANSLVDIDDKVQAALLDPFGLNAFSKLTEYWSPDQRNSLYVPFEGLILWNRLLWLGVGLLIFSVGGYFFSFNVVRTGLFKKKAEKNTEPVKRQENVKIPFATFHANFAARLQQTLRLSRFYLKMVLFEVPFIAIVFAGLMTFFNNAVNVGGSFYGVETIPTTYSMLDVMGAFNFFLLIIVVFYTGELYWKERDIRLHLILDAAPMPDFLMLFSKFLAMVGVYAVMLAALIATAILVQITKGYYNFELGVYIGNLYTETLLQVVLYTVLGFFVQSVVNQKFMGFATMVLFFIAMSSLSYLGLEHSLFQFNSGSLGQYSDMNTYGPFVFKFSWYKIYWVGFAAVLFAVGVLLSARGSETILKTRLQVGKTRLSPALLGFAGLALFTFVLTGGFIFYNTNVLHEYSDSDAQKEIRANYEKTLKQFEELPQPKIVDTYVEVDIFPETRDFKAKGRYVLKNKTNTTISEIHVQQNPQEEIKMDSLYFSAPSKIKKAYEDFEYFIYALDAPLAPGDSVEMHFAMRFETEGFSEGRENTSVVRNGTFFNNTYFPGFGYSSSYELSSKDDRKEYELEPERERKREQDDPIGLSQNLFGDDADRIRFEIILSTAPEQTAIAPGYLQRSWEKEGRRYFHYKMDKPMVNFYSIVSAKYEVMRDKWNDVNLEIYYHKGHDKNLKRMMDGMKDALSYYSENFSPYQYRQLRIMEFPRYSSFAQSFANTVPYSESMGFISNIQEDDIDVVYYVTAHEVAHQWWGHQVTEANVKGSSMLSESLSQYSALMVMNENYPQETVKKYLRWELNGYLRGRAFERKKEMPIAEVESQQYIHYQKGSLVMFALQDYLTEDSVNLALKRYVADWAHKSDPYPTTKDLIGYFKEVTPDSLNYIIQDLMYDITFYENKVENVEAKKLSNGNYQIDLKISTQKIKADSTGRETTIPMRDWVDIGVFTKTKAGEDSLIYLQKHLLTKDEETFQIEVSAKPSEAGVDPLYKLIDRHPKDNTEKVELED